MHRTLNNNKNLNIKNSQFNNNLNLNNNGASIKYDSLKLS
jgi:hypothetical protein